MAHSHVSTQHHAFIGMVEAGAQRVAALWNAHRNRRSVARLLEWDDRMLRDIGLTQNDVRSALASRAGEDPADRLGAFSGERRQALRASARERHNGDMRGPVLP